MFCNKIINNISDECYILNVVKPQMPFHANIVGCLDFTLSITICCYCHLKSTRRYDMLRGKSKDSIIVIDEIPEVPECCP